MIRVKAYIGLVLVLALAYCVSAQVLDRQAPAENRAEWLKSLGFHQKQANAPMPPYLCPPASTPRLPRAAGGTGAISGRVTQAAGGAGIQGVDVRAAQLATCPSYGSGTLSDADGFYIIDVLPPGKYRVCTDNDSVFVRLCWNDKPLWETPDTVVVTANDTAENIDFSFREGGKITGTLTFPDGFTGWGFVNAVDTARRASYQDHFTSLGGSASYVIERLPTGIYKVRTTNYDGYIDLYYDDQSSWTDANLVSVTEGATTSAIDFALDSGGTIQGSIAGASKGPLNDVLVLGYYASDPHWSSYSWVQGDGDYELIGLRSGYWKVFTFGDTTYALEWYNDKGRWDNADSIYVSAPGVISDVNFDLNTGGSIAGHVHSSEKGPLSGYDVIAYERSFYEWGILTLSPWTKGDTTTAEGSYRITGLRTGDYYVMASGQCYAMWYNNKPTPEQADLVHVTMPDETFDIDFNLPSAVEDEIDITISRPVEFELGQNRPNPFNPRTEIKYTLKRPAKVTLQIHNLLGRQVKTLVSEYQPAGAYRVVWDGKNSKGEEVSSGVYFYRLKADGISRAKRMVLLK